MSTSKSLVKRTSLLGPILPDELVWSYYARVLARFPTLTFEGLASLLGGELPSWSKSFPTRLSRLADAFNFADAPDVSALILGHSFFPFAVPEITAGDAEQLAATLANHPRSAGAPDHLVLPGSFKLRVCPTCMEDDQQKYGAQYWHRLHQLPLLRVCCAHRTGLHETDVTAGIQDPVPVTQAVVDLLPMNVGDARLQRVLAEAYGSLALIGTIPSASQVHDELERTFSRRGLYHDRRVSPALTFRLKFHFDRDALKIVGVSDHEIGLTSWCSVPKLALAHFELGECFGEFLVRAAGKQPAERWGGRRDKAAEHQRELVAKVHLLAPAVVKRLVETSNQPITPWAIAKALNPILGKGFASNWSYRELVKEALGVFAETEEAFYNRMLERMRKNPAALQSLASVDACASAFGLGQAIRRNEALKDEIRHLFLSARAAAPV